MTAVTAFQSCTQVISPLPRYRRHRFVALVGLHCTRHSRLMCSTQCRSMFASHDRSVRTAHRRSTCTARDRSRCTTHRRPLRTGAAYPRIGGYTPLGLTGDAAGAHRLSTGGGMRRASFPVWRFSTFVLYYELWNWRHKSSSCLTSAKPTRYAVPSRPSTRRVTTWASTLGRHAPSRRSTCTDVCTAKSRNVSAWQKVARRKPADFSSEWQGGLPAASLARQL